MPVGRLSQRHLPCGVGKTDRGDGEQAKTLSALQVHNGGNGGREWGYCRCLAASSPNLKDA